MPVVVKPHTKNGPTRPQKARVATMFARGVASSSAAAVVPSVPSP